MSQKTLIEPFITWNEPTKNGMGIIVSGDSAVEWILPFFIKFAKENTSLPITFFDQGLTRAGAKLASKHFDVIPFQLNTSFVCAHPNIEKRWKLVFSDAYLSKRPAWFHKPFLLLASPYEKTLWVDIDCRIQHPPEDFLKNFHPSMGFAVAPDFIPEGQTREATYRNLLHVNLPGETVYNSGVLYAEHGSPFVQEWAAFTLRENGKHLGDQDTLIDLCYHKELEHKMFPHFPEPFGNLPKSFNWNHLVSHNPSAHILHYHSTGKKDIYLHMHEKQMFDASLKQPHLQMFFS